MTYIIKTEFFVSICIRAMLHPSAPSSSDDIVAKQADASAKIQISGDKTKQKWNFLKLFGSQTVTVTAVTISTTPLTANAESY